MQLYAILLLTANLAVSVIAAPVANTTNVTSSSSGPSAAGFLSGTNHGDGTFYAPALGACGIESDDTQLIAAVSHDLFDNYPGYMAGNPNNNPVCGRKINVHYNGSSVEVTVVDRCVGCNETSLDFSSTAFKKLADSAVGRIHDMTWTWAS